jgi:CrcB protein
MVEEDVTVKPEIESETDGPNTSSLASTAFHPLHITPMEVDVFVEEDINASKEDEVIDQFVMFCVIALACIAGAYIRLGLSFLTIWHIETSVNYRYFNFLGSFLMGFLLRHRPLVFERSKGQFYRYFYVALTTGLCGSITSFSTLQAECNKSFFLQWDYSWGNNFASHNGGKFIEWLMCMFGGVAQPLVSFYVGKHAADLSPLLRWKELKTLQPTTESIILKGLCASLFLYLLLVIVCGAVYQRALYHVFMSCFAVVGGYLRYRLAHFNLIYREFPFGTFIANIAGSWMFAIILVISKFGTEYYDVVGQAALYGVLAGFCGCLTTISTFVKELSELPAGSAYRYGIASSLMAQVGFILLYNSYAYTTISLSSAIPDGIDICQREHQLCGEFLRKANCSSQYIINSPCQNNDYNTYDSGTCQCMDFGSDRFSELLVDSQVSRNINAYAVAAWPKDPLEFEDSSQTYDLCLTHQYVCSLYLGRIGCPDTLIAKDSCGNGGIDNGVWECACGPHVNPGNRILKLITDSFLYGRYDLIPYYGYATMDYIDFENAFLVECSNILDHVNCPEGSRTLVGNTEATNYATWVGRCECGSSYDVNSVRVAEVIFDVVLKPLVQGLLVRPDSNLQIWDACSSYENICNKWLDKMSCPSDLRHVASCQHSDPAFNGTLMAYNGACECGAMSVLTDRPMEWVIDSLVVQTMWNEFG